MFVLICLLKAFFVGGLICFVGQLLFDKFSMLPAQILVLFVVLGAVLGATGIYEKVVKFAGAGATVPIVGFGYLLSKGAIKAVEEEGFVGVFKGGLSYCSLGISVAIFMGILVALIFSSKRK